MTEGVASPEAAPCPKPAGLQTAAGCAVEPLDRVAAAVAEGQRLIVVPVADERDGKAAAAAATMAACRDDETRVLHVGNPLRSPLTVARILFQLDGDGGDAFGADEDAALLKACAPASAGGRSVLVVEQAASLESAALVKLLAVPGLQLILVGRPNWLASDATVPPALLPAPAAAFNAATPHPGRTEPGRHEPDMAVLDAPDPPTPGPATPGPATPDPPAGVMPAGDPIPRGRLTPGPQPGVPEPGRAATELSGPALAMNRWPTSPGRPAWIMLAVLAAGSLAALLATSRPRRAEVAPAPAASAPLAPTASSASSSLATPAAATAVAVTPEPPAPAPVPVTSMPVTPMPVTPMPVTAPPVPPGPLAPVPLASLPVVPVSPVPFPPETTPAPADPDQPERLRAEFEAFLLRAFPAARKPTPRERADLFRQYLDWRARGGLPPHAAMPLETGQAQPGQAQPGRTEPGRTEAGRR